jgi:phosphoenolpyruvate synthase/pyruvate phosphate dikinase
MSARFGTKAANLGFLCHPAVLGRADQTGTTSGRLATDLVPFGFAVPFTFYERFMEYPPNANVKEAIAQLIVEEKAGTLSSAARAARVNEVQSLILDGQIPPGDLAAIKSKLTSALPGVDKVKVRSSANAEDVPNFDGAGLHDSLSATICKPDNANGSCRYEVEGEDG